jgi:hypothetical protein
MMGMTVVEWCGRDVEGEERRERLKSSFSPES